MLLFSLVTAIVLLTIVAVAPLILATREPSRPKLPPMRAEWLDQPRILDLREQARAEMRP